MASDGEDFEEQGSAIPEEEAEAESSTAPPKRKRGRPSLGGTNTDRMQRQIEKAIAKFRGWPARDIIINNEGYGAILQALKKEYNLKYNEGAFSEAEVDIIRRQVKLFMKRNRMTEEHLKRILYGANTKANKGPMKELILMAATALNGARPYPAVREFIQRQYREGAYQGRWTKEELVQLKASIEKHGNRWAQIAEEVGRAGEDCRKKYELISMGEKRASGNFITGKWSDEDAQKLIDTVDRVAEEMGIEGEIPSYSQTKVVALWDTVAKQADIRRDATQCRNKYFAMANRQAGIRRRRAYNMGTNWNPEDRLILVDRITAQLRHSWNQESDINWEKLSDDTWNWPAGELLKRWEFIKEKYLTRKLRIPNSFVGQLELIRRRVLRHKEKYVRRKEKEQQRLIAEKKQQKKEARAAARAAAANDEEQAADDSDRERTPPSAQPQTNQTNDKGKGKATEPAQVLGKRLRTNSSDEGTSSDSDENLATALARKASRQPPKAPARSYADSDSDSDSDSGKRPRLSGVPLSLSRPAAASRSRSVSKGGSDSSSDSDSDTSTDSEPAMTSQEVRRVAAKRSEASTSKANAKTSSARKTPRSGSGSGSGSSSGSSSGAGKKSSSDSSSSEDDSSSSDEDSSSSSGESSDSSSSSDSSDSDSDDDEDEEQKRKGKGKGREMEMERGKGKQRAVGLPYDLIDSDEEDRAMRDD
ncbi:hypothetical protein CF326_g466 [Tilletia indica]|nr:hypothetical protein CF326_g466 [Tilletia indica]